MERAKLEAERAARRVEREKQRPEREAKEKERAARRTEREAREARKQEMAAMRAARARGEWLTGQLVAVDFPAVDEAAMLSLGWIGPTWRNLSTLAEFLEAQGAGDLVDGKLPEFFMGWNDGLTIYGDKTRQLGYTLDKAVAVGLLHPTRPARSGVTPRTWVYNPAAGAIVKQIWRGIVERGKRRGRRGGGV